MNSFGSRRQWVYDPAARRVANKALDIMSRTMDHIHATGMESEFDLDRPSEAACALLAQAAREVAAGEVRAHATAKRRMP